MKMRGRWLARPFLTVGTFLFGFVLVPFYRALLLSQRRIRRLYLPAKNRFLFIFSNRYAIHAAILIVVISSAFMNVRGKDVHAEGIAEDSVLFILVGGEGETIVEEVAKSSDIISPNLLYNEELALSSPTAREIEWGAIGVSPSDMVSLSAPLAGQEETTKKVPERKETQTYIVREGDTISSIAASFGLSLTTVLWANDLSVRSVIRPGNELIIMPTDGVIHKVKSGETMSRIALRYDVAADEIAGYNQKSNPNALSIGELLIIPGAELPAPSPTRQVASVASIFTNAPGAGSPARSSADGMIWPTDLRKINLYFGVLYFLGRHTGIDIDCERNNTNYAAADGLVSYAGWRRGYGYSIDIDHGNGLKTRYGHNARLYVTTGESVAQGEPIALCGNSGISTGTHLHFEVIVNGRQVNPLGYVE